MFAVAPNISESSVQPASFHPRDGWNFEMTARFVENLCSSTHTHTHTHIPYIHAYVHTNLHSTYIHHYIHVHIRTYIYTYIQTYITQTHSLKTNNYKCGVSICRIVCFFFGLHVEI